MMSNINRSRLVCFDNVPANPPPPPAEPNPEDQVAKFTQADLNKFLAEDRRKHQGQIGRIQQTLEETLANKNLTTQERDQLAGRLSELENEGRTKEQQAAHERKQLEEQLNAKLAEEWKGRTTAETKYCEAVVKQSLTDAAAKADAWRQDQLATILRQMSRTEQTKDESGKYTGEFKVVIDLPDMNDAGEAVTTVHTPDSAVKRMKELPNSYGNLFKSGVVSGIGSGSGAGVVTNGKLDVRKLTPQQYQEIRAKNPELLGLRREKRRAL